MIRRPLLLPAVVGLAAGALVLTGCGSGSSSPSAGPTTGGSTSSTTTQGEVQGVRLTADGSSLHVGDTARVAWHPDQRRTGVIGVRVTRLQRVPLSAFKAWRLTGAVLKSTPYYVHATVTNLGTSNLSQVPVPLYVLDQQNTLLQASTFQATFDACPSRPFPASFTHGKRTSVCLVYFAPRHDTLTAVSFRPTQDVAGITWRGHVTVVKTPKK